MALHGTSTTGVVYVTAGEERRPPTGLRDQSDEVVHVIDCFLRGCVEIPSPALPVDRQRQDLSASDADSLCRSSSNFIAINVSPDGRNQER